jgi:hypothetical protein
VIYHTTTVSTRTWSVQELHDVTGRQVCGSKASIQAGLHGGASRRHQCIKGRIPRSRKGKRSRLRVGSCWVSSVVVAGLVHVYTAAHKMFTVVALPLLCFSFLATASRCGSPERPPARLPRTALGAAPSNGSRRVGGDTVLGSPFFPPLFPLTPLVLYPGGGRTQEMGKTLNRFSLRQGLGPGVVELGQGVRGQTRTMACPGWPAG